MALHGNIDGLAKGRSTDSTDLPREDRISESHLLREDYGKTIPVDIGVGVEALGTSQMMHFGPDSLIGSLRPDRLASKTAKCGKIGKIDREDREDRIPLELSPLIFRATLSRKINGDSSNGTDLVDF